MLAAVATRRHQDVVRHILYAHESVGVTQPRTAPAPEQASPARGEGLADRRVLNLRWAVTAKRGTVTLLQSTEWAVEFSQAAQDDVLASLSSHA